MRIKCGADMRIKRGTDMRIKRGTDMRIKRGADMRKILILFWKETVEYIRRYWPMSSSCL